MRRYHFNTYLLDLLVETKLYVDCIQNHLEQIIQTFTTYPLHITLTYGDLGQ